MGLSDSRKIKSFTEVVTRVFTPTVPGSAQGEWQTESDTPIDDQINQWVEDKQAIILQVTPSWNQVSEALTEGRLVRRSILRYAVVYTNEASYFETEAKIRKMSLLGEGPGFQTAREGPPLEQSAPAVPRPPACPVNKPAGPVQQAAVAPVERISDAGGPPGINEIMDARFFKGADG